MDADEIIHKLGYRDNIGTGLAELLYSRAKIGDDLEDEVKDMLKSVYQIAIGRDSSGAWFVADRCSGKDFGNRIYNPATKNGGFPNLTSLLKWCIANRST